jgi:carbon storage regulator
MLVLSRKVGQKIVLGDHVTITINRISGHRVSIGIVAPEGMRVIRSELKPHDKRPSSEDATGGFSSPVASPKTGEMDATDVRTAR